MKTSFLCRALQASLFSSLITYTFAQSATVEVGAITTLACYSNVDPLQNDDTNTFQSSGNCQKACSSKQYPVMALTGGSTCYCGDMLPATSYKVDDSNCNMPCKGYDIENCGGIGYWRVFLTGLTGDVETASNTTSSSSSSTASGSSTSTHPAQTVVVTEAASAKPSQNSDSGPNKIGIAVGVVVGVIVIAALAGGAILYIKQKRRREIEEEHKAQAAINSFVGSRHSDAKSDARLDPSVASSYRRESIGSIADERDFSRRILQVRNPDRGSMTSVA